MYWRTESPMNSSVTQKKMQKSQNEITSSIDYLKNWPLFLLPQHFLSSLIHRFMRIKQPAFKNLQIRQFIKQFNVNMISSTHSVKLRKWDVSIWVRLLSYCLLKMPLNGMHNYMQRSPYRWGNYWLRLAKL